MLHLSLASPTAILYPTDLVSFIGEKWKILRVAQTRLFSTSKIKQAVENNFNPCSIQLVEMLKRKIGANEKSAVFELRE